MTGTVLAVLVLAAAGCAGPSSRSSGPGTYDAGIGRQILAKARQMIDRKEIIQGGCWDYINAIYTRCGYPENRRQITYKTVKRGPYVDVNLIKPGDWLYFVNHSYGGIEHSSIFVDWESKTAKRARMISYAGEKRREPARYMSYDLSEVYAIIRPKP